MKIQINHSTQYFYESEVKKSVQLLRVTPQTLAHQKVLMWQLSLPRYSAEVFDGFGNYCTVLNMNEPHSMLNIQAQGIVEIDDISECNTDNRIRPEIFLNSTRLTECNEAIRDFAHRHTGGQGNRSTLGRLAHAILEYMPYTIGSTDVLTTAGEAFERRQGVCQDHTHVFITAARELGVPTRYVSGYLYTKDDHQLTSHAWAEACLNGYWFVFDVSNQLFQPSQHVQLAVGLDYNDAAPVRGMRQGGGAERMEYLVQVSEVTQ